MLFISYINLSELFILHFFPSYIFLLFHLFLTLLSCSLHTCRLMNNWFLFIAYVLIFQLYTMSDCLLLFISLVCTLSPKIVVLSICCNAIFLLVIGTHVLIVVMCLVWSLLLLSQMRVLFLASFFVLISDDWSLSLPFNKEWFCSSHFLSVLVFPLIHDVFMLTWHDIVFVSAQFLLFFSHLTFKKEKNLDYSWFH